MNIFEENLTAIFKISPYLHSLLSNIDGNDNYEVFFDASKPKEINLVDKKNFSPMYKTNPWAEVQTQLIELKKSQKYPYLYVFGIANGVFLKELLQNQNHKQIFVVEPDIELLYIALNLIDFSKEIQAGRVVFIAKDQINFSQFITLIVDPGIKYYARLYDLHVNGEFYEKDIELITNTNRLFIECLHHRAQEVGNDATDSLVGVEHHFMNLPLLLQTPPLFELLKKSKNTKIALLVSTGPSLTKQIPLLKKIAQYVTIFAVDASLPVLSNNNIKPDVVVSMERIPLSAKFFIDTPKEAHEDVIFALSSLQHPKLVNSLKAGTMQMSMRPFGYMMNSGPKEWGYVGIGMSAANMAYEIIYHSHFENCVLIGQDLSYSEDGTSHAVGHVLGVNDVKPKEGDGWCEAYGGEKQIRTTAIWNIFRKTFEKDIVDTKIRMKTINATEGGARINGTIEMSFEDVANSLVDYTKTKEKIKLNTLKKSDLKVVTRKLKEQVKKIEKFIETEKKEAEKLFLEVIGVCERIEAGENVQELEKLVLKVNDFKEHTKYGLFDDIVGNISQGMLFPQDMVISELQVKDITNDEQKEQNLKELVFAYKNWLFNLAGCLDAIGVAMTRKGSHYEEEI